MCPNALRGAERAALPGSLSKSPYLDAWIRIDAEGMVTVFTGKAELGQGLKTAIIQIAAEELEVLPNDIRLITADTALTANEGFTAGSHSIQDSGAAIRNASAQVRELLIAAAAQRWQVDAAQLRAAQGSVISRDGRSLKYGQLVENELLHAQAQPQSKLKAPSEFLWMGTPMRRVDIPAKVAGGAAYVQDMKLPGMAHARVVRPPSAGATLISLETSQVESMPGVIKVHRDGNFLAVIARQEYQAVQAMRKLAAAVQWAETPLLPDHNALPSFLMNASREDAMVLDQRRTSVDSQAAASERSFEATFTRAYQCHGSIGPSCAVALLQGGSMTVWSHSQGVFPNRAALAELLGMPAENIRGIHVEGSGCYGHNGADDVAADAALIAHALPDIPIRVQWTREQEHMWEPFGPAMVTKVRASLDERDRAVDWHYELWSNTHATRPGSAGALLPARLIARPFLPKSAHVEITPEGSGDRNAIPIYDFPGKHVKWHFLKDMPIRVSALRSLGAYMNVFTIESFMDELARAAQKDPVSFRLNHLQDARAAEVINLAAQKFNWSGAVLPKNHGKGFAFARYKNLAAYCAIACEVSVEVETGRVRMIRAVAAVDSGEIVNPDGIRNQIEGGILQSMSWTLYEAVKFTDTRITSADWSTYPILRFSSVPDSLDVHLIARPGQPFLGTGEAAQGPAAAALGNAVANALGKRLRDIPFTPERVRALAG
jgi:nicotinate dehydrogenase subunit B